MAGRKTVPKREDVFASLYGDHKGLNVTDDELLAYIGGMIRDRKRAAASWRRRGEQVDDEAAVQKWLDRHRLVMPWLESHGWSIGAAVEADERFMAERLALSSKKRSPSYGTIVGDDGTALIVPGPGESSEEAAIETAQVDRGFKSEKHFVSNTDYIPVHGSKASVCPHAGPPIRDSHANSLADHLREIGSIRTDQTIHWVGWKGGLENACDCNLDAVGISSPQGGLPSATPGPFGIQINEVTRTVSRSGHNVSVDLSNSAAMWHTFTVFFRAGEHEATENDWKNGYIGSWDGRHRIVSRLREQLATIDLTVPHGKRRISEL